MYLKQFHYSKLYGVTAAAVYGDSCHAKQYTNTCFFQFYKFFGQTFTYVVTRFGLFQQENNTIQRSSQTPKDYLKNFHMQISCNIKNLPKILQWFLDFQYTAYWCFFYNKTLFTAGLGYTHNPPKAFGISAFNTHSVRVLECAKFQKYIKGPITLASSQNETHERISR